MFKDHAAIEKLKEPIDKEDNTYLHVLSKQRKPEIVKILIEAGLNINAKNIVSYSKPI
jgi:ankyrin repeat protein